MEPNDVRLSPRYWELLGYLADGNNNREIAQLMGIRVGTVENYTNEIYGLLDLDEGQVDLRVAAARWYWDRRDKLNHNYIFEIGELPVIIEVRKKRAGNNTGSSSSKLTAKLG